MTDNKALRAGVALLPELKRALGTHGNSTATVSDTTVLTIIAALEASASMLASQSGSGPGCKLAWKQGFCYGDPEYYPPSSAPAPQGMDVVVLKNIVEELEAQMKHSLNAYSLPLWPEEAALVLRMCQSALAAMQVKP